MMRALSYSRMLNSASFVNFIDLLPIKAVSGSTRIHIFNGRYPSGHFLFVGIIIPTLFFLFFVFSSDFEPKFLKRVHSCLLIEFYHALNPLSTPPKQKRHSVECLLMLFDCQTTFLFAVLDCCLCCCKSCDRNAER